MRSQTSRWRRTASLCLLETGLGAVAIVLIHWFELATRAPGLALPTWTIAADFAQSIGWGIIAALPLLLILARSPSDSMQELLNTVVVPHFRGMNWLQLAMVAAAAGWGEELMFRGLLQTGIQWWWPGRMGMVVGWVLASVAFGVMHWLSDEYFFMAIIVGLYLGACLVASRDIVVPITAHALYDFIAILYLLRWGDRDQPGNDTNRPK